MNRTKSKIGVYVCRCGTNIAATVDVDALAAYAERLDGVVLAREYSYMCSDPGQELIQEDIHELDLNRIVVASCSPLMHEMTFRSACEEAGLNPFFFQMANIREQCSWSIDIPEQATEKGGAASGRPCNQDPSVIRAPGSELRAHRHPWPFLSSVPEDRR